MSDDEDEKIIKVEGDQNLPTVWLNQIRTSSLHTHAKHIACVLRSYMNGDKTKAWPALKTIAKGTSISKKTVIIYLKVLEEKGWIEVVRTKGGFKKVNNYIMRFPDNSVVEEPLPSYTHNGERTTPETVTQLHRNKQCNKQNNKNIYNSRKKGNAFENLIDREWCEGLETTDDD